MNIFFFRIFQCGYRTVPIDYAAIVEIKEPLFLQETLVSVEAWCVRRMLARAVSSPKKLKW